MGIYARLRRILNDEIGGSAIGLPWDDCSMEKQFQLIGRVRPTLKPKESDGLAYDLGCFDSLEAAEGARRERWAVGWGVIEIVELDQKNR